MKYKILKNYRLELSEKPRLHDSAYGTITGTTLNKLLGSMDAEMFNKEYVLVDCRFPYEYNGGHIKVFIWTFGILIFSTQSTFTPRKSWFLFSILKKRSNLQYLKRKSQSSIVSFRRNEVRQCNFLFFYSTFFRAKMLRSEDRKRNLYPRLHYKEMYLLDYGYHKFFLEENFRV